MRYIPFADLRGYRFRDLQLDLTSSSAVLFLSIPQGVAYALIAGLPPVMGLYAAAMPAIVGSLFRSSRDVVTGPTNALSLLVGTAVAGEVAHHGADPATVGVTLAFLVGSIQLGAGLLRLDLIADYVSMPVVRGYISGAAVLIAIGQLANATGTPGGPGAAFEMLWHWGSSLGDTQRLPLLFAVGTLVAVVALRRLGPNFPSALVAMVAGIACVPLFGLDDGRLRLVSDLGEIPRGLPPFTVPSLEHWRDLLSPAVACAVLSFIESSSVARSLSARRGQQLDMATEFSGQGLANLAAGFFSAYPVSGSLSRSALNQQAGASTRMSGILCGFYMIAVLLALGPIVAYTPIASLAGLLLLLAYELIDWENIRTTLRGTPSDRAAFLATLGGTWVLPLDKAIYLGVGISVVLFLRRARLLTLRELAISDKGRFREISPEPSDERGRRCPSIRIMNLAGPMFFAVTGELEDLVDPLVRDGRIRVLILRLRQVDYMDVSVLGVLEAVSRRMASEGRTLLLLGIRPPMMEFLERTGVADRIGRKNVFPVEGEWFSAMTRALARALEIVGDHECGGDCPLRGYLQKEGSEDRGTDSLPSF